VLRAAAAFVETRNADWCVEKVESGEISGPFSPIPGLE